MTGSAVTRGPLILFETFEITAPFAEYEKAVHALCHKIEEEGVAGALSMHYYADREAREAYMIFTLKDADAYQKHNLFLRNMSEVEPYRQAIKLKQIRAFGEINAETAKRFREGGRFDFQWVPEHVTGFTRNTAADS